MKHDKATALRLKWANIPGVTFPTEKKERKAKQRQESKPKSKPENYAYTAELAERWGVTTPCLRARLHGHKCPHIITTHGIAWQVETAEKIYRDRNDRHEVIPEGWYTTWQACDILNVTRTSLERYIQRGYIRTRLACAPSQDGNLRQNKLFLARDVEAYRVRKEEREKERIAALEATQALRAERMEQEAKRKAAYQAAREAAAKRKAEKEERRQERLAVPSGYVKCCKLAQEFNISESTAYGRIRRSGCTYMKVSNGVFYNGAEARAALLKNKNKRKNKRAKRNNP